MVGVVGLGDDYFRVDEPARLEAFAVVDPDPVQRGQRLLGKLCPRVVHDHLGRGGRQSFGEMREGRETFVPVWADDDEARNGGVDEFGEARTYADVFPGDQKSR